MEVQLHPFILAYGTLWLGPAAGVCVRWRKKNPSLWRKLNISSVGPNRSHYTHWAIVAAHASSDTIFGNSVKVPSGVYNCTYIIHNRHFVTNPNLTYTNRCIHKARLKAVICLNASLHVNLQFTMSLMTQHSCFRLTFWSGDVSEKFINSALQQIYTTSTMWRDTQIQTRTLYRTVLLHGSQVTKFNVRDACELYPAVAWRHVLCLYWDVSGLKKQNLLFSAYVVSILYNRWQQCA
jgi:hypothetical protein